ncbi:hypothetical protein TRIUR3_19166 [Triticum urartu]|uniref:Uncharacterized protein n=1 Tax=Triticum urartu TaxID=4572 RepID=M7YKZ9_TRIUA|nr:hypothetical protein TRIUR3_19166 [Triticum urartu]
MFTKDVPLLKTASPTRPTYVPPPGGSASPSDDVMHTKDVPGPKNSDARKKVVTPHNAPAQPAEASSTGAAAKATSPSTPPLKGGVGHVELVTGEYAK